MERKIAALFLGLVFTFGFVSCETEADNSLALAALALSSDSSGAVNPSTENTCKITFDANGGSITTATQTVTAGKKTALKSAGELGLNRTNYAFVGWATKSDATEAEYNDAAEVTLSDNLTLYALWNELSVNEQPLTLEFIDAGTITITNRWSTLKYSLNGGDLTDATDSITVATGDKVCFYAQKSEYPGYDDGLQQINCDADCYLYGNIMSLVTLTENGEWNPFETSLSGRYLFGSGHTFSSLFYNNTHIKNHDSKQIILLATKLTRDCYCEMFSGCTSLTTAPELPAETLAAECYFGMFYGCTSLTTAPELKATTLAEHCCDSMFFGCTSLHYVKCLATNIRSTYCTDGWLDGVSASGTFVKAKDMASWGSGVRGIPSGWTVEDAE